MDLYHVVIFPGEMTTGFTHLPMFVSGGVEYLLPHPQSQEYPDYIAKWGTWGANRGPGAYETPAFPAGWGTAEGDVDGAGSGCSGMTIQAMM